MFGEVAGWAKSVAAALPSLPPNRRLLVALAGPPASGKSTLAAALVDRLGPATTGLVEMDAFHFDNSILETRGHRGRKGAPHTFDAAGLSVLLAALRDRPDTELSVPRFDRALELSRNCAVVIGPEQRVVVVEGNYLLASPPPWGILAPLFDLTVRLEVATPELERRILARWSEHGLGDAEARRRWETNDRVNGEWVSEHSIDAMLTLTGATSA